jgi:hypothetical protein
MPPQRRTWADIMSDDDEDDDYLIVDPGKGAALISEDTYQGQHPDAEASKCSMNLALEAVDFSDSSFSTPFREKRQRQESDAATAARDKKSPPAKVARTEPVWGKCEVVKDTDDAASRGPTPKEAAQLAGSKAVLTPAAKRGARSSTVLAPEPEKRREEPTIDWERRRETRQKQIDKGKDQIGYKTYKRVFPVPGPTDPRTPRAETRADRKTFDFELKVWKTFLHKFDPPEGTEDAMTPKSGPAESTHTVEPVDHALPADPTGTSLPAGTDELPLLEAN